MTYVQRLEEKLTEAKAAVDEATEKWRNAETLAESEKLEKRIYWARGEVRRYQSLLVCAPDGAGKKYIEEATAWRNPYTPMWP